MDHSYFLNLMEKVKANTSISDEMYELYNVKRGLRNKDGTGVLVGLTEISSVMGYIKEDEEVIPIEGKLYYRGISVEEIVDGITKENRYGFEEVIYLLLTGELPNKEELENFKILLAENRHLPRNFVRDELSTFKTHNIMNALSRAILTLYSEDKNPDDISLDNILRQGISLIAKFPVIVAYSYRIYLEEFKHKSLIIHRNKKDYMTAENFLHLIRDDSKFSPVEAKLLDISLILHADHGGGNNSTFTTRVVSSSGTDTYSAIAAAVGSLKGPLHGGANLYVMNMMDDIKANVKDWSNEKELKEYIYKILNKKAGDRSGKIYGFGHAVYTLSDPRAKILKKYAKELAEEKGRMEEYNLYNLLEKVVPEVFYEVKGRKKIISPNVDFYSGFVYDCLGIPRELYTPIFAMGRIAGWIAHRIEELLVSRRIIRPAYKNVTPKKPYIPLEKRDKK